MRLLIRFLRDTFELYQSDDTIKGDIIQIKGTDYKIDDNSKSNEGFLGFFDWLRKSQTEIIGIRLCFFEHQAYNSVLVNFPYVQSSFENKCMEIFFTDNIYNFDLSGDQDFTNNYVYISSNGDYLFTFPLDFLKKEELDSLLLYCKHIYL